MSFISELLSLFEAKQNTVDREAPQPTAQDSYRDKAKRLSGSVVIPGNIDEIGDRMFDRNKGITSVVVPGTVKRIGERAFADCENLASVTLGEGIEEIGSNAFTGCKKLRRVTYPDSVKVCCGLTFYNTALAAPVTNASGDLLVFCPESVSGKEWTVPSTVKTIATQAFFEHEELEALRLPDGLEKIERMAFIKCGIREIVFPRSVREIGNEAFWRCEQLEKVVIPNPETKVAFNAFGGCVNLRVIEYDDLNATDRIFHLKGQPFLIRRLEDHANLRHRTDPEFVRLTARCAQGDGDAMEELANWFEKLSRLPEASRFYLRASNYWRYRAYVTGNDEASDWFTRYFLSHPGEPLESILNESCDHNAGWYTYSVPGGLLNDLGYSFFDPQREYEIKSFEEDDVVEVSAYESSDDPDEDGFGAEDYYDWWFLDENMQEIPGVKSVNASMRERDYLNDFKNERSKAEAILKQRKRNKQ